jgi:hypothetical protein
MVTGNQSPRKPRNAGAFDGYDSFDALYVVSTLELRLGKEAELLSTAVYELIADRLGWSRVCILTRETEACFVSRAIWKLPTEREGESYLDGMALISTWDEYAAISELIVRWDINLCRSSGFAPVRVAAQRRHRSELFDEGYEPEEQEPRSELEDKRIQFKDDLVIATAAGNDVEITVLPKAFYEKHRVTNRFRFVETLAKNGVTMAQIDTEAEANQVGAAKPFKFINLRGLREKTEWS